VLKENQNTKQYQLEVFSKVPINQVVTLFISELYGTCNESELWCIRRLWVSTNITYISNKVKYISIE